MFLSFVIEIDPGRAAEQVRAPNLFGETFFLPRLFRRILIFSVRDTFGPKFSRVYIFQLYIDLCFLDGFCLVPKNTKHLVRRPSYHKPGTMELIWDNETWKIIISSNEKNKQLHPGSKGPSINDFWDSLGASSLGAYSLGLPTLNLATHPLDWGPTVPWGPIFNSNLNLG